MLRRLVFPLLISVMLISLLIPATLHAQDDPQFYRTVEVSMVRIINAVNIRDGAGTGYEVVHQGQVGEEFAVREDVEPIEANGYTWMPIIVDDEPAWVAQAGFVELFTVEEHILISPEEVEAAYVAELPEGAMDTLVEDNHLYAVDAEGVVVAVWDWGEESGEGEWITFSEATQFLNEMGGYGIEISFEEASSAPSINTKEQLQAILTAATNNYANVDFKTPEVSATPNNLGVGKWYAYDADDIGRFIYEGEDGIEHYLSLSITKNPDGSPAPIILYWGSYYDQTPNWMPWKAYNGRVHMYPGGGPVIGPLSELMRGNDYPESDNYPQLLLRDTGLNLGGLDSISSGSIEANSAFIASNRW
ncbi:MAG: hypothetical protein JXQ72_16565 [Anaerolineae bacterium]|nr:hypothetical protein [Anaerolineae bacterium]